MRHRKLCKLLLKKLKFVICAVYEETAGLMVNDPVLRTHKVTCLIKFVELFIIHLFASGMRIFLRFRPEHDIAPLMLIMFNMSGIVTEPFNSR